jgi:hypothetical protein
MDSVSASTGKNSGVESPFARVPQKLICEAAAVFIGYRGLATPVAEITSRGRNDVSIYPWLRPAERDKILKRQLYRRFA